MGGIPPLDDESLRETVEAYKAAGGNAAETARRLGKSVSTVKDRLYTAAARGLLGTAPVLPGFRISRISTGPRGETIEQKPEPEGVFTMPEGHALKGVSAYLDGQGNVVGQWVKTKAGEFDPLAHAEAIKEALSEFVLPPLPSIPQPEAPKSDTANVFVIADPHMGQLSWEDETGAGNYDIKIALQTIRENFDRLVSNTPEAEQGVILGLGDNAHVDGYKPLTPQSGHFLDADGRYPRILKATTGYFLHAIAASLLKHTSVLVRVLPGNHDPATSISVAHALSMRFHDEPRVTIDDSPDPYWWWEWGLCLVGAHHGDKGKMKDLPMTMAARNAEAWGRTKFRHIYTGHIHHQTAMELGGVIVESFRAVTAPDAYNAGQGYSNGRSLRSITLHKQDGEIGRQTVNIV